MDELGRVYGYALGVLAAAEAGDDEDALDAAYGTRLLRSDGRIAAVGDWTAADLAADLAAVHARAGRDTSNEQSSATSETTRRRAVEQSNERSSSHERIATRRAQQQA